MGGYLEGDNDFNLGSGMFRASGCHGPGSDVETGKKEEENQENGVKEVVGSVRGWNHQKQGLSIGVPTGW